MEISITYGRELLEHTADSNLARACVSVMLSWVDQMKSEVTATFHM